MTNTEWTEDGWEAEYYAGWLILTTPTGEVGSVQITATASNRNVTLNQFRSAVKTHGVKRACETFWKLRAKEAA